ncbi:MAG: hypothetical protein KDC38_08175 [Planctomycetes bacterium]|nr:hypothetical protein [Planctomycetota bacterium]
MRTTAGLIVLLGLGGCDSPTVDSVKQRAANGTRRAVEEARQLGRTTWDQGAEWWERSSEWSGHRLADFHAYGERLRREHADDINAVGAALDAFLRRIALDPEANLSARSRVARMMVVMIPFAGPTKRFADARALFGASIEPRDDARLQHARRECLLACAEIGLDITAFGLIEHADLVATGLDRVLTTLKVTRSVGALVHEDADLLSWFLDQLLDNAIIRDGIDTALRLDLSQLVPTEDGLPPR